MEHGQDSCIHLNDSGMMNSNCTVVEDIFLSRSSLGLRRFSGVMTVVIIIMGILGNGLTIAALIKCKKIRNLTVAFIISLCVADFATCVLVMPYTAYRFLNDRNYFGDKDILCTVFPLVQYWNIGVSLLTIAMITINRFVMIAYPDRYKRIYTPRSVAAMVAFSWLFSLSTLLPTLARRWGEFGLDTSLGTCSIINSNGAKRTLFLTGFLTPCLTIVFCYAGIFYTVHKSKTRMQGHGTATSAAPGRTGSDWRLTKMILIIFLSFLFCYLPTSIIKTVDKKVERADAHVISYVLIYLSACINPIIYVTMNRQFRQAYKSVLFCSTWVDNKPPTAFNSASGHQGGLHRTASSNVATFANQIDSNRRESSSSKRASTGTDIRLIQLSTC